MFKVHLPFIRSPYNYDVMAASDESGLLCSDPSLAQQSAKDECDINIILERYARTGELSPAARQPQFGDFTGFTDFHSSLNAIRSAQEAFMLLPANVRTRFDNDAGKLVDFCSDASNRDEAIKLGLVVDELPLDPPRDTARAVGGSTKGKVSTKPSVSSSNDDLEGGKGD